MTADTLAALISIGLVLGALSIPLSIVGWIKFRHAHPCAFGHDQMRVPHLPGYGMAPAWVCRQCSHHFPGFRYPPMPRVRSPNVPPINEDR